MNLYWHFDHVLMTRFLLLHFVNCVSCCVRNLSAGVSGKSDNQFTTERTLPNLWTNTGVVESKHF
jgi:hypothetical protein